MTIALGACLIPCTLNLVISFQLQDPRLPGGCPGCSSVQGQNTSARALTRCTLIFKSRQNIEGVCAGIVRNVALSTVEYEERWGRRYWTSESMGGVPMLMWLGMPAGVFPPPVLLEMQPYLCWRQLCRALPEYHCTFVGRLHHIQLACTAWEWLPARPGPSFLHRNTVCI